MKKSKTVKTETAVAVAATETTDASAYEPAPKSRGPERWMFIGKHHDDAQDKVKALLEEMGLEMIAHYNAGIHQWGIAWQAGKLVRFNADAWEYDVQEIELSEATRLWYDFMDWADLANLDLADQDRDAYMRFARLIRTETQ
jgi:hypothetical protein